MPSVLPLVLPVEIRYSGHIYVFSALIDSTSAANFLDRCTIVWLHLPLRPLNTPIPLHFVDGGPIGTGTITHCTPSLTFQINCFHQEDISFLMTESPNHMILGIPWLSLHNPNISWEPRDILKWSEYCIQHCLNKSRVLLASMSIKCPDTTAPVNIPPEYEDFQDVFNKAKAPPHRPYDCAIDFLPGTMPPCCQIYP